MDPRILTLGVDDEHRFVRPTWDCSNCRKPWPCPDRKQLLLRSWTEDGDYRGLGQYLGGLMEWMARDLHELTHDEVAVRLLGWVPWRSRRPTGVLSR